MTLLFSDEQTALADSLKRFVAQQSPLRSIRSVIDNGHSFDPSIWKKLSADLGLAGLTIPTEFGGSGSGWREAAIASYELGAGLVPSPLLGHALAAATLMRLEDADANMEYLPRLANGELIATVADSVVRAKGSGSEARLSGAAEPVLNGADADLILVAATHPDGSIRFYAVDVRAAGLTVRPLSSVDHTRALARLTFEDCIARPLAGDTARARDDLANIANLLLASEACGALERCITMTADYGKIRIAFGNPIGAYQGFKHRLANLQFEWELARVALREAGRCADEEPEAFAIAASTARLLASASYQRGALATIQLHGGIGYTWEHDAHLFYKNSLSNGVLFGQRDAELDRLADLLHV